MQNDVPEPSSLLSKITLGLLGLAPLLLILTWVCGNMTLPGQMHRLFQDKLSWPWLSFEQSSAEVRALVDLTLCLTAYLLTECLGRSKVARSSGTSNRIIALGITLFCVMSCWQYTGIILWAFRVPFFINEIVYYVFVALALKRSGPPFRLAPALKWIPFLALAFFVTGTMSLDRLLFSVVTLGFLMFFWKPQAHGSSRGI
jgi:hypothetical protein